MHEYNKLNMHWNKRNAIYFTVEYHAVTRRNLPNFKYSGNVTFWLTSFKTCFEAFANWTWLSTRNRIELTMNCLAWPQGHFRIKTKFSSRQGLFTISKKKNLEILVGIFVRQERYVLFTVCLKFPHCGAAPDWILVTTWNLYSTKLDETQETCKW